MAVAACGDDLSPRSSTPGFPEEFSCSAVGSRVRATDAAAAGAEQQFHEWSTVATLPTGRVQVSAMPITNQGQELGFAILVHDLSYIEEREAEARTFLIVVFGILAVLAFGVPMLAAKRARSDWSLELRSLLRGGGKQSREFQPILSDLRELVGRMAIRTGRRSRTMDRGTAETNSEPAISMGRKSSSWQTGSLTSISTPPTAVSKSSIPASGLVTALEPVMRACSGVWIAHGSGSADRETVDRKDHIRVPPGEESYHIRRVWLSEEEQQGYYYGFSNEGLWPLCHVAHARPVFRAEDWRQYRAVNQKFADAVCSEVDSKDPIILVQDYHFALAPAMIRKRLPAATVIVFWHIPWPNAERMGICPWRNELLEGLLGSSIVGFHTQLSLQQFPRFRGPLSGNAHRPGA